MELTTLGTTHPYMRRTVLDTIYQEETTEIIVPDSMPDIDRILDAYGTVIMQDKRCENGELRISGGIQAGVLYVAEDSESIEKMEAWLPFTVRKKMEAEDGCLIQQSWLRSIDARMINSRKITIRANLGMQVMQFSPEDFQLSSVEPTDPALQLRRNTYPALLPVACTEQEFRIQDELQLPETVPAIDRILKWDVHPNVEETRMIGDKAVFKGDVVVEMLYLGTDNSINTWVGQLPYSQYAELPGEWPEATVVVFPTLTSAQLETDGQMESRTLLADLSLMAQVCVIDRIELELTEDAYVIGGTLTPQWQTVSLHPQLDVQTIRQTAELTVPANAREVVSVSLYPDHPSLRRSGESIYATSALSGNVIFRNEEGKLQAKPVRGEVSCSTTGCEDCRCYPDCRLTGQPTAAVSTDGIRISAPVAFTLELYQEHAWQNLCGGTIEPEPTSTKKPSVIVRRVAGGDLWNIAKQVGATVNGIQLANGLTGNQAPEGEILLIPLR